ncbi:PTS transporter subunit EIIC [Clostridium sp. AM58-1XD]|uniref:PTS transporter subunit EIIC n=1 Tax=Clostridium sp. AM58-1XD TaxID=2292307 RepID=UPI002680FB70
MRYGERLNALFVAMNFYEETCGGYLVLNAIGDGLFHFMPLFLGYTAAKKFRLKPMLGLVIGAIMCYPTVQSSALSAGKDVLYTLFTGTMFESKIYTEFFGLPMIAIDYTGSVIPVIFVVYFASKCEKFFSRFIPDLVKFFFVPMLTLMVAIPAGFLAIGPLATFGSAIIAEAVMTVRSFSPMLAGAIVGLTWQILVIFGLHWGFIPVYINNIMTNGYDNVMMPFFACTFATSAVVLAIFFKTKDRRLKEMALPNFISGIFGVTEPAIYGILLPLKKPFIISCIAGCIGGGYLGAFNFRKFMMGGMGIFEFPAMIEPDGSMGNLIVAVTGVGISMVVAFVLTMIFYREPGPVGASGSSDNGRFPKRRKAAVDSENGGGTSADQKEGMEEDKENNGGNMAASILNKVEIASPLKGRV